MKKSPLFELVEERKLPNFQYIDAPTIQWIIANKPRFNIVREVELPKRNTLNRYIPKQSWFSEKRVINSIHGLRHILRVVAYVSLISQKSQNKNIKNILVAAAIHDIRRKNDKSDTGHGLRAAHWFRKNVSEVAKEFKVEFTSGDEKEIFWTTLFHESPRHVFLGGQNYSRFKESIDMLRIADALDRYRLPKTKWWISNNVLKYSVPTRFKKIAFEFMVKSEQNFLDGKSSKESVLSMLL